MNEVKKGLRYHVLLHFSEIRYWESILKLCCEFNYGLQSLGVTSILLECHIAVSFERYGFVQKFCCELHCVQVDHLDCSF